MYAGSRNWRAADYGRSEARQVEREFERKIGGEFGGKLEEKKVMKKTSTLRMIIPEWHGGLNPNYVLGAELLACIAPVDNMQETVRIPVDMSADQRPGAKGSEEGIKDQFSAAEENSGVDEAEALHRQMQAADKLLREKNPDRVIVFGGDCSVTQVPFAYLNEKFQGELGVIWLDAHPDVSGTGDSSHLHEMVLGNLLGLNPGSQITQVKHPLKKSHVIMAGLIEERLRHMDRACRELNLRIASPESLKRNSEPVLAWIKENGIRHVAIHWDLDVLSPVDFRSIYPAEPYTDAAAFPAAVGRMTLDQVGRLLRDVSAQAELVGLSITEHLPWDAIRMRNTLAGISLFKYQWPV